MLIKIRSQEVVGPPPPMSGADSADDMRNKPRRPPRSPSKDLVRGKLVCRDGSSWALTSALQ